MLRPNPMKPLFFLSAKIGLLFGMITAPLSTHAELPNVGFPLGRHDLQEIRTIKQLRPGITHVHVQRGQQFTGNHWGLLSGKLTDESAVASLKNKLHSAGLSPITEHRLQPPSPGEPYHVLHTGKFSTKLEARQALLALPESLQKSLQVANEAALADWNAGPFTLNLVIVDPKHYRGKGIVSARTPVRSRPSELSLERNAVAAINAGFFNTSLDGLEGITASTLIIEGQWYHEPNSASSPGLFIENTNAGPKLFFAPPPPMPEIQLSNGKSRKLDGIGRLPRGDEITVLRPETIALSSLYLGIPDQYFAAQPGQNGNLTQILSTNAWDHRALTLVGSGKGKAFLEEIRDSRESVKVDLRVQGQPRLNGTYAMPLLLRDGEPLLNQGQAHALRVTRSAIGAEAGGKLYLLSVDGDAFGPRADGSIGSVGANYEELLAIFQFLGATDAVNLDGGGALAIEGQVASRLYSPQLEREGIERPVSDSILVLDEDGHTTAPEESGR